MPESMPLTKMVQPAVDTVRMQRAPIFPRKHIACVLPAITNTHFPMFLIDCISLEQRYTFLWNFDIPLTFGRLGRIGIGAAVRGQPSLTNMNDTMLHINLRPFQTANLTSPAPCYNHQMNQAMPFNRLVFQRRQDIDNLFRLKCVDLLAACPRRRGFTGSIIGNDQFFFCLP